jgi:hypothetical protein
MMHMTIAITRLEYIWCLSKPFKLWDMGQIYTNQTGTFPITSSHGNKCIIVLYNYDRNAILTKPLKSRLEMEMIRGYTKLQEFLTKRGLKPLLQKLDNKAPAGLKNA